MNEEKINIEPYKKAVISLEEALNKPKDSFIRDSVVQRFEYTYELAIKFIKRILEATPESSTIDQLSYRDFCRMAAEVGLIKDPLKWFEYREARNSTSHAYDEKISEDVYKTAGEFLIDAKKLLENLEAKYDKS